MGFLKLWLRGTALLVMLMGLLIGGAMLVAPVLPDAGVLIFVHGPGTELYNLYSMDMNQRTIARLVSDGLQPDLSVDGRRIAFAGPGLRASDIYLMRNTGRDVQQLTDDVGVEANPAISPDGTRIAFEAYRGGSSQIEMIDLRSNVRSVLRSGTAFSGQPAWSPDGSLIAHRNDSTGSGEIWLMNADGSDPRQISDTPGQWSEFPAWSPDGTQIAFTMRAGNRRSLYVIDSTGGLARLLLENTRGGRQPIWTPDGAAIIIDIAMPGYQPWLYTVPLDGGPPQTIEHAWNFRLRQFAQRYRQPFMGSATELAPSWR